MALAKRIIHRKFEKFKAAKDAPKTLEPHQDSQLLGMAT
jgi:hypothetical protein